MNQQTFGKWVMYSFMAALVITGCYSIGRDIKGMIVHAQQNGEPVTLPDNGWIQITPDTSVNRVGPLLQVNSYGKVYAHLDDEELEAIRKIMREEGCRK